jgi:hypothetical protein
MKGVKMVLGAALVVAVFLLSCENATNGETSAPPFDPSASFPAPSLEAGDSIIIASWDAVPGADLYGVYYGRVSNGIGRVQYGPDIQDTSVEIRGLVNLHTYYVWVQAKDIDGYSIESEGASLFLLERLSAAPGVQVTGKEGGRLEVSWDGARQATAYEVWYGTEEDPKTASKWPLDITGTAASLVGLVNNQIYYVWVRSKTVCGESAFSPAASALPQALLGGRVAIDGNLLVGETLTANTGGLDREGARSYRWHRADTPEGAKIPIPGAEAASHTPDNNDWNKYLSVEVTVEGSRGSVTSPATGAVGFPRVSWTPAAVTPPLSGASPSQFMYCQVGGQWKWLGPGGSGVLLSDDGMNWEQITTPASPGDSIVDTGLDSDMRFVSSNGMIHSPDGRTWHSLNPNRTVRCVAYGTINGFGMYVAAYGQRGLLYSSNCKIWAVGSPDYSDTETGIFGPGQVIVFEGLGFNPLIDRVVFDEENRRFIAQADLGPYVSNKCAYSTDAYNWDGPHDRSLPAAPVEGDAALFYHFYAYPNGVYSEEIRFIDNGRAVSLPQGMAGSFGYFSIDGRPAVLTTRIAVFSPYSGQSQWNFYSLDQPGQ